MADQIEGLSNLIADIARSAQSDAERRLMIRSAVEHALSEGMMEMTETVSVRPPTIDQRFRQVVKHWSSADAYRLEALYFEMKAELAEDLGYYLGRLKQIEREVEHLRRVCVENGGGNSDG